MVEEVQVEEFPHVAQLQLLLVGEGEEEIVLQWEVVKAVVVGEVEEKMDEGEVNWRTHLSLIFIIGRGPPPGVAPK